MWCGGQASARFMTSSLKMLFYYFYFLFFIMSFVCFRHHSSWWLYFDLLTYRDINTFRCVKTFGYMSWKDLLKSFAFWRNPLSHNFGKCDQPPIHTATVPSNNCNSLFQSLSLFNYLTLSCNSYISFYSQVICYEKFWRNLLGHNFAKCDWLPPPLALLPSQ